VKTHEQRYLSNVERQKKRIEALISQQFSVFSMPKARNVEELAMKFGIRSADALDERGKCHDLMKKAWALYSGARQAQEHAKNKKAAKPKSDVPKKKNSVAKKAAAKKAAKNG